MKIKIGNKIIGENKPCFIIAEVGVNHNGKISIAKKMVDAAVNAGADAVKFQTFTADGVTTNNVGIASYALKNIRKDIKQIDMLKQYELRNDQFIELKRYCDEKKIIFLSTPHSFDAIDFLNDLIPAYKIGSGDVTNIPALQHAGKKGKPIILGTGMSTIEEVQNAINAIESTGNKKIIALHCTTNYPCPMGEVNLNAMKTMQKKLNCLVGFSDHTLGITASVMAVTLGAVIIEKHFTIDKKLSGPDHKASLNPMELKKMTQEIKNVERIMGSFNKKPTSSEKETIKIVRKSIVSKNDIEKGSIIKHDMLAIKRPGTGLEPTNLDKIVGKKTKKRILKDEIIKLNMVE